MTFALRRLRNEAQRTEIERSHHIGAVMIAGKDHDRDGGVAVAQLSEDLEPVAVRQSEVEQNERQVRVRGDEADRLAGVYRFHHCRLGLQLPEDSAQRLTDQDMIVDDKDLHAALPEPRFAFGRYITPGRSALPHPKGTSAERGAQQSLFSP